MATASVGGLSSYGIEVKNSFSLEHKPPKLEVFLWKGGEICKIQKYY
jgi:hypothetical protein